MSTRGAIRVLIADDSAVSRRVLADLVSEAADIEVVATATSGKAAIEGAVRHGPDVVLMDVLMPGMDGLDATREIMREAPCRIILVSELVGRQADLSFRALEAGALDVMRKPSYEALRDGDARSTLLRKIRTYACVPVVRRHRRSRDRGPAPPAPTAAGRAAPAPRGAGPSASRSARSDGALVCIGASTGGPPAIRTVLEALDSETTAAVLITQHMTEGFIQGMAAWLDSHLRHLRVAVAGDGEIPQGGHVYLAPDNAHLRLVGGILRITSELPGVSYRPSIDVLFESVAQAPRACKCVAALLTGMGRDGARGLLALRGAGAHTIAQDEASSIVYGMPRAAHEIGAACEDLPLLRIGERIRRFVADESVVVAS